MNTSSKNCWGLFLFLFGGAFFGNGCSIQGPWEYAPQESSPFRGLYIYGYLIADQQVSHLCVERTLGLDEYSIPTYAWYRSAELEISGDFGGGEESISLSPQIGNPSCFFSPPDKMPRKGEAYRLKGEVEWDSAGHRIITSFASTAVIPTQFSIRDSAKVIASALHPFEDGEEDLLSALSKLPPEVFAQLNNRFPGLDSAVADPQYGKEWFAKNGRVLYTKIGELLMQQEERVYYHRGDTISYLTGPLNLATHYFRADYSADVAAVLVTQRIPDGIRWPENSFSRMFGMEPEPWSSYSADSSRRLQLYPAVISSGALNFSMLDSISIMNIWFHGGENLFMLYGVEKAYRDYYESDLNATFDTRIKRVYNIEGAAGYFIGAIADSFNLIVRLPPDGGFSNFEAHADYCLLIDWGDSQDCRLFDSVYCRTVGWNDLQWISKHPEVMSGHKESYNDCFIEGINVGFDSIPLQQIIVQKMESKIKSQSGRDKILFTGLERGCVRTNYGRQVGRTAECLPVIERYFGETPPPKKGESELFSWCEDRRWAPEQCLPLARRYCVTQEIISAPLCKEAEKWCQKNETDQLCP